MDPILQKFRNKFFEEATSLLDQMEKDVLELEKDPQNKELIESAFRAMHTIKGVSGMYGFDFICEFTHCMESVYQAIREGKLVFNKEIFDITFCSLDHIRKLLADEKLEDRTNQVNHNQLMNDINIIIEHINDKNPPQTNNKVKEETQQVKSFATWHIMLRTDENIYFRGINLVNIFRDLATLGSFQISRLDYLSSNSIDVWSIILSSDSSKDEIDSILCLLMITIQ
jgi:two-component system chemotaxis sensor kinase CheA